MKKVHYVVTCKVEYLQVMNSMYSGSFQFTYAIKVQSIVHGITTENTKPTANKKVLFVQYIHISYKA